MRIRSHPSALDALAFALEVGQGTAEDQYHDAQQDPYLDASIYADFADIFRSMGVMLDDYIRKETSIGHSPTLGGFFDFTKWVEEQR